MLIDRKIYFDNVRINPFGGAMTQQQVDGQNVILDRWEADPATVDLRWLSYCLATVKHESASTMWAIEEYGKGYGMIYGIEDPETKQTYYGRGLIQITWRDNYAKATKQLGLSGTDDLEWHADRALDMQIASDIMYAGMIEGWFRSDSHGPHNLPRYFSNVASDPYHAREIINGDKHVVPSWSGGMSIGNLIADYHYDFFDALEDATKEDDDATEIGSTA
jgi:hypothetical protein